MKMQYWGTAAYEGIPSLFCCCEACKNAAKNGGKDIRTRTQALIDDDLLVDFPADTYAHFLKYGYDFGKLRHLLITHSHSDHLYADDLGIRRRGFSKVGHDEPLHIYVGESGRKLIEESCEGYTVPNGNIVLHDLIAWQSFQAGAYTVTPIPASHAPNSSPFVFLIEKGGKTLFYANDTGALPAETYGEIKRRGFKIDFISADCTMMENPPYYGHFGLSEVADMEKILRENGNLRDGCKTVITHFSHNAYVSHAYMEKLVEKYGYGVAYDGMTVEF